LTTIAGSTGGAIGMLDKGDKTLTEVFSYILLFDLITMG